MPAKRRIFSGYVRFRATHPWMGSSLVLPPMLSERSAHGVVVRTPAKVNLFLEVLGKRPDGYHDLATLMVTVGLYDTLEFKEESTQALRLHLADIPDQTGKSSIPDLSTGPDNLIVRAAELLRQRSGCGHGVQITLHKRIPMQAGLAGGSSDAAATLLGLNRLWRLGLRREELARLGAELGSDVAFFFAAPAAWCTGRGEITTPLQPGRSLWLVLVCPRQGLSTPAVFRALRVPEQPLDGQAMCEAFVRGDLQAIARNLHNRLQPVAEQLCPLLVDWRHRLERTAPLGCLMSGSGTTLFALCRDRADAHRVVRQLGSDASGADAPRVLIVGSCF